MNKKMKDEENSNLLVGYVRKSNADGALKISIHNEAFQDCQTYTSADGEVYTQLLIGMKALLRILNDEKTVTSISQINE